MKKEQLVDLGLDDNQIAEIFKINGKDIEKHKAEILALETEIKGVNEQLETANKQIEEFADIDVEKIKQAADDYKKKYELAKTEKDEELKKVKFEFELERQLTKAGVRNTKAVKALLNDEGLAYSDDKIVGLDEQLENLKENESYLFKIDEETAEDDKPIFARPGGAATGEKLTKEDFAKLSYTKRTELYEKDKNLYDKLTKQQEQKY